MDFLGWRGGLLWVLLVGDTLFTVTVLGFVFGLCLDGSDQESVHSGGVWRIITVHFAPSFSLLLQLRILCPRIFSEASPKESVRFEHVVVAIRHDLFWARPGTLCHRRSSVDNGF